MYSEQLKTLLATTDKHRLADELGVPFRTLQSYQYGERKPAEWVAKLLIMYIKESL